MTDETVDRVAIAELVVGFDDAVNRRDPVEFARFWTTDAIWEIGDPLPLRADGVDTIVVTWQRMVDATKWLFVEVSPVTIVCYLTRRG